jgi:uncharacterized phiE125 gp8 family phage protein
MLTRLSNPEGYAVPLAELKAALRVDHEDDDARLQRAIRSETRRYEDFTDRVMLPTNFEFRIHHWRTMITLPCAPIRAVTAVAYLDEDGAEQSLGAGEWYFLATDTGGEIRFTDTFTSPALYDRPQSIMIRFAAGYDDPDASGSGDDPDLVAPEIDRRNISLMVLKLYDGDEAMEDSELRRIAGNRRIFR